MKRTGLLLLVTLVFFALTAQSQTSKMNFEVYVANAGSGGAPCFYGNWPGIVASCMPNTDKVVTLSKGDFANIAGISYRLGYFDFPASWTSGVETEAISLDTQYQQTNYEVIHSWHNTNADGWSAGPWRLAIIRDHQGNFYLSKAYDTISSKTAPATTGYEIQLWDPQSLLTLPGVTILYDTLYISWLPNGQMRFDDVAYYKNASGTNQWAWRGALVNISYPLSSYSSGGYLTPPSLPLLYDYKPSECNCQQVTSTWEDLNASALFGDTANPTYRGAWIRRLAAFGGTPFTVTDIAADQQWVLSQQLGIKDTFSPMWAPCNTGLFQANAASDTPPTTTTAYVPPNGSASSPNTPCAPRAVQSGDVAYQLFPSNVLGQAGDSNPSYGGNPPPAVELSATSLTLQAGGTSSQASGARSSMASDDAVAGQASTGSSSSTQSVTVTNSGQGPLIISGMTLAGSDPSAFSESDNCSGTTLSPASSCTVNITYTPDNSSSSSATLSVVSNSWSSPDVVSLSGTMQ